MNSGFVPTEQQKILAAVREMLLSDEFIEELAARIIDRTLDPPIAKLDEYDIIKDNAEDLPTSFES